MAKFLFTMLPANDLGLPTRLVPIARTLADRGHAVAVFNPAPAPSKLIAEAGLQNLPMPSRPMPAPVMDLAQVGSAWDVEELFAAIYSDDESTRGETAVYVDLIRDYDPDVVIDSFGLLTCLAARVLAVPLVTVLQGNIHPASDGFLWWMKDRPTGLPSAVAVINKVAAEHGLGPVERCVDLLAGDLSLIVGTPETDPLPATAGLAYIGPIVWQRGNAILPDWVAALGRDKPVIWVYSGNPRYGSAPTPCDSIVVIRAAITALGDAPVQVVLTTGYQDLPEEFGTLPSNFHHAAYLPGRAMAERCDLMVHHGGHSSVMTGLSAGTPAVIIPTITERESNARRLAALGAGEVVLPVDGADGEKHIDLAEFNAKVHRVLSDPGYFSSARRVAESMRKFGGAHEAADRIERFAGGHA
ncbi:MAG: nucleotide disphospho-sugar-binding domain-containing protein [Terriglobales bacterium]|jgi:UDP:flavonoid glycosyltransferase YjiC (YdhE family)